MSVVIGTRGSALALRQATLVATMLGEPSEIRIVRTVGDDSDAPMAELGDGAFVTAIERLLLYGEIDVAVHSLKDLPTEERPGLLLAAIPVREDPRDVLVTQTRRGRASLPQQARVGSSSPRRAAFLRTLAPDIEVVGIRGNVDTRMRKVASGEYDATILALAGLRRLAIPVDEDEILSLADCLPAPGQGALAIQCREDDVRRIRFACIDDPPTRRAVTAERILLHELGASCELALGAHGHEVAGELILDAALEVAGVVRRISVRGSDPHALGRSAADRLGRVR